MAQTTDSSSRGDPGSGSEKFIDKLKDDGLERVRTTQRSAATQLEGVAAAIDRAGSELNDQPTLAHYAGQLANGVSSIASRIKEGSLDDLASDAQRFARTNPGMFLLGSVGLGIVLARFLKASSDSMQDSGSSESMRFTAAGSDAGASSAAGSTAFSASSEDSGIFGDPGGPVSDADTAADLYGSTAAGRSGSAAAQARDASTYRQDGGSDA